MHIIGLTGVAGSGKDTVADLFVKGHGFTKIGFADALYSEVSEAFGVSVDTLRNRTTKESPMTELELINCHDMDFLDVVTVDRHTPLSPRRVLQWWGTEYRRAQNEDYWVNEMARRTAGESAVVIPDVRFQNEANMILNHGGTIICVERPGYEAVNDHVSEHAEIDARFIISNDGSVFDLQRSVQSLFSLTKRRKLLPNSLPDSP